MPKRTCTNTLLPHKLCHQTTGHPLSVLENILTGMEGYIEVFAKTKLTTLSQSRHQKLI